MSEPQLFGHTPNRIVQAAILLTTPLTLYLVLVADGQLALFGGLAIGVALVVFAGGVSYAAVRQQPTD